jgi:glycosyltransferase involved in cell wall biosynthesis
MSILPLLIVVPTLNSHTSLPRLLSSLQQQTWPHWRLLFIDGPSRYDHRRWLINCCTEEVRCRWVEQTQDNPGIFGAMNQGFALAPSEDWVLFWGSDDWAAEPQALSKVISAIEAADCRPDLLVCKGRYADPVSESLGRHTYFQPKGVLHSSAFRRALWLGSTPPHQGTLFGPGARSKLAHYAPGYSLSADLDYFLQLSRHRELCVMSLDLELVHMADSGISGQQTPRRLQEVCRAYRRVYRWLWWWPFFARYVRRLLSLIPTLG